jgi:hypothetical protein
MRYDIITRGESLALGRKRYYTGQPCKHGHDAQRFVSTGACVACNVVRSRLFANSKNSTAGRFVYSLHPDDHAAALAYCQALDLARGRTPRHPQSQDEFVGPSAEYIERAIALTREALDPPPQQPYLPAP